MGDSGVSAVAGNPEKEKEKQMTKRNSYSNITITHAVLAFVLVSIGYAAASTGTEQALIPEMLAMSNLYLLYWGVNYFFSRPSANASEYVRYLKHSLRLMRWITENHAAIVKTAKAAGHIPWQDA